MTRLLLGLSFAILTSTLFLAACSSNPTTGGAIAAGAGIAGTLPAAGTGVPTPPAGTAGQTAVGTAGAGGTVGAAGTGVAGSRGGSGQSGSGQAGSSPGDVASAGTSSAAGAGETPVPAAGTSGAAGAGENPTSACVSGLKPCKMRDKFACSSFTTVDVGTLVKATEFKLGPYGAIMEQNVGKGFEVPENASESGCPAVASLFGEPADVTADTSDLKDVDLTLYTVYRPACPADGEKFPVITWGNGTCGQTEAYGGLLRYVASHGYIIFASNSRYTGGNGAMTKALDFAEAANKDANSVYYNRLDMEKVGAMGHSQGGGATVTAASDARIDSLIIWNASTSAVKPFLAVSGDSDVTGFTASSMAGDIGRSTQPSAWLYYHKVPQTGSVSGHLTLMIQPERVVEAATAWWDYMLKGDTKARDMFIGDACGLCGKKDDFEYGEKGLK
jgi:hypothetical protein